MYYKICSNLIKNSLLALMCFQYLPCQLTANENYRNEHREQQTRRHQESTNVEPSSNNLLLPHLEETTSPIVNNNVLGIIFDENMLYTINAQGQYNKKQLLDSDLSDINFFKKYENLKSVIFCNFKFTEINIEYIKDYLSNKLTILTIDNCSFEHKAIDVFTKILSTQQEISSLKLKSSFNNENITKIMNSLTHHKKLKYFDIVLSEVTGDIITILATIIKNSSSLESLLLHCDKFSMISPNKMRFGKINKSLKQLKKFKEFVVDIQNINNNIVDDVFKCFANLSKLESLSIYFGNIYDTLNQEVYEKITILSNSLNSLKTLKKITISNTNLQEKEMYLILDTISKDYSDLSLLDISGNKLGENSLKTLCDIFKNNNNIQTLNLGFCDIGKNTQSLPNFLSSLVGLKNLKNLYLQNNYLEKMPAISIPAEENFSVDLSDNAISYDDIISFVQTPATQSIEKNDSLNKNVVIFNFQNNRSINRLKSSDLINYRNKLELLKMKKPYFFFGV